MTSRYSIVDSPVLTPGKDWITGTTIGPFVDTGVEIQFAEHGRLYIAVDTIREIATLAGLFASEAVVSAKKLDEAYQKGYDEGNELNELLRNLNDRVNGVFDIHADTSEAQPDERDPEPAPVVVEADGDDVKRKPRNTESDIGIVDGATVESDVAPRRRRPARVPTNTSDVNPFDL